MGTPERVPEGGDVMRDDTIRHVIVFAVIGVIAGWLGTWIVPPSGGGGLLTYLIAGVIGAFVGGYVLNALKIRLPIANPWISQIVTATIGAIIVLLVAKLIS